MSNPHNPNRYGECWPLHRISAYLSDMKQIRPYVTFSGGWAWHLLSPPGHAERKHAHDHKDVDIFCPKANVGTVIGILASLGYVKTSTKYDSIPSSEDFRRYERVINDQFRLTIDFFVGDYPTLELPGGWRIVRPSVLLSFYGTTHSSDKCWAVQAATKLLKNGEKPGNLVGRSELLVCPDLDMFSCPKCKWVGQFSDDKPIRPDNPSCGGCGKYMARNMGKPTFQSKTKTPIPLRKQAQTVMLKERYGNMRIVIADLPEDYRDKYPFKHGEQVLLLGEIQNMQGHVAIVTKDGGVRYAFHADTFREPLEEEL